MIVTPFEPKGEKPEWRMIYDELLAEADYGGLISYRALQDVLGRPLEDNRSPLYRARLELGEQRHRWLEVVPGVGYRVIEAAEHLRIAQAHKRKARRQFGMMVKVGEVTDLARLTPTELATFDAQQRINVGLFMIAAHHERRIARIEELLREEGKDV